VSAAWATRGGADGKEDIDIPTGNNNDANADIPAINVFFGENFIFNSDRGPQLGLELELCIFIARGVQCALTIFEIP